MIESGSMFCYLIRKKSTSMPAREAIATQGSAFLRSNFSPGFVVVTQNIPARQADESHVNGPNPSR